MGLFGELKKLFFAGSSVAKSAAEKTGDMMTEHGGDILEKGKNLTENLGESVLQKTSGLKDAILDGADDLMDSGKDFVSKTSDSILDNDMVNAGKSKLEEVGSILGEKGSEFAEKFGETSEKIGEKILDKGGDLSEKLGEKVLIAKDQIVEKANEAATVIKDKFDETMEKAEAFEAAEKAKPKKEFADDTLDASGSLLEGKDDFFSKADKFGDGEYDAFSEGKIEINDTISETKDSVKEVAKAAGFSDLDGDGNEMIDDAILEEE